MCSICEETDLLAGYDDLDIRFDVDNAEIDVIYMNDVIDSIEINYCPFCGRKLK
jgi:hypothetical protein